MFILDFVFALVVAALLSLVLVSVLGWRHPARASSTWSALLFVFVVILFGAWAGGLWIGPLGPALWDAYWLPVLVAGLLIAFVLAAAVPRSRPPRSMSERQEEQQVAREVVLFGGFFWILTISFLAAVLVAYVIRD